MSTNGFGLSKDGVTNEGAAEEEAQHLAALIISGSAPANELRRLLYASKPTES
ncbi:hypothetical protein NQ152_00460 [Microbacterium sp. zg.B48]|uniref:hypothetical protein n=1 Tax=Microbacterium sp. zg.B48 TaxID=2969408 RepID=UPI00214C66CD|nr:hypothetical protein [Microbacterium sp. zg.B48]MCR2761970.1 hypothetical protein [Microbacterium sp. zg.B48]